MEIFSLIIDLRVEIILKELNMHYFICVIILQLNIFLTYIS